MVGVPNRHVSVFPRRSTASCMLLFGHQIIVSPTSQGAAHAAISVQPFTCATHHGALHRNLLEILRSITLQFQVFRPRNGTALVRGLKAPRQGRECHTAVYDSYHITMVALNSPSSMRDRYARNDIPSGQLHKYTHMWKASPLPLRHIQHRKLGSLHWNIALTEQKRTRHQAWTAVVVKCLNCTKIYRRFCMVWYINGLIYLFGYFNRFGTHVA